MAKSKPAAVLRRVEGTLLAGTDASIPLEDRKIECTRRFTDLGLGRGVDATSSKPWLNKSSFQVRRVTFDSLLGTEDGGAVEAYMDEVSSVKAVQLGMKASAVAPTTVAPVKVGVEAELNRSVSNTRHTAGRRVVNRNIAFKEEFDDTLFKADPQQPDGYPDESRRFEDRLMAWVLENLEKDYGELCPDDLVERLNEGQPPGALFKEWHKECVSGGNRGNAVKALSSLCYDFVGHFRITHYVSCLWLGAVEYSVMSKQEFLHRMALTSGAGISIVQSSLGAKHVSNRSSLLQRSKKVGAILNTEEVENHVPRGTYAEAVIAVEFTPITTLVRNPHLHKALTGSIAKYIEDKGNATVGPFLIVAQSRVGPLVYLSIDLASMTLQATTSKHQAKPFIIMASEENANDFHIVYINVRGNSHRSSLSPLFSSHPTGYRPLPHYLTAHRNIFGYSSEPLRLEINPPFQDTLFHLHSRLRTSRPPPEDPGPWVTGKEAFFISCSTRWLARDAYIAVRREVQGGGSYHREVQGGEADRREVQGGGADPREVQGGGAQHREVQGGGSYHREVQGGGAQHREVQGGGSYHREVQGGEADRREVQGGGADPREVQGGGADPREVQGGGADPREVQGGGADPREVQGCGADYKYTPVCIPQSAATEDYLSIFHLVASDLDSVEETVNVKSETEVM